MKYTFEGLEKEIEDIVAMVEKAAKVSRKCLDEKGGDPLIRLSKAMIAVNLAVMSVHTKIDVLEDLTERMKELGIMNNRKRFLPSNSIPYDEKEERA